MSWKSILKLSEKQKKIAEQAEPKDKITGEDFKRLKEKKKKSKSRGAFTDRD